MSGPGRRTAGYPRGTGCEGRRGVHRRGTHREKQLGWLLAERNDRGERVFVAGAVGADSASEGPALIARPSVAGTLRVPKCPDCRRDKPISQPNAARLYDGLTAGGRRRVDISRSDSMTVARSVRRSRDHRRPRASRPHKGG